MRRTASERWRRTSWRRWACSDSTRSTSSATTAVARSATDSPSITSCRSLADGPRHRADARHVRADGHGVRAGVLPLVLPHQPEPLPERLIGAAPEFFLREKLRGWARVAGHSTMPRSPNACGASRTRRRSTRPAGITAPQPRVDLEHDRADRDAGRRVRCSVLALWGGRGTVHRRFRPLEGGGASQTRDVSGRPAPPPVVPAGGGAGPCCRSCSRSSSSPRRGAVERARAAPSGEGVASPVVVARHS